MNCCTACTILTPLSPSFMNSPHPGHNTLATPLAERRFDGTDRRRMATDRRQTRRMWQQASADRRANAEDRRRAVALSLAVTALALAEQECARAEACGVEAEARWCAVLAAYEQAETVWSDARAERSRTRAALGKAQNRVEELKRV